MLCHFYLLLGFFLFYKRERNLGDQFLIWRCFVFGVRAFSIKAHSILNKSFVSVLLGGLCRSLSFYLLSNKTKSSKALNTHTYKHYFLSNFRLAIIENSIEGSVNIKEVNIKEIKTLMEWVREISYDWILFWTRDRISPRNIHASHLLPLQWMNDFVYITTNKVSGNGFL